MAGTKDLRRETGSDTDALQEDGFNADISPLWIILWLIGRSEH